MVLRFNEKVVFVVSAKEEAAKTNGFKAMAVSRLAAKQLLAKPARLPDRVRDKTRSGKLSLWLNRT